MSAKRNSLLILGTIILLLAVALMFPVIQGDYAPNQQRTAVLMQCLTTASRGFRVEYGDWPQGEIAVVFRALSGENPRQIAFIEIDRRFVNSHGAPTDTWGTPLKLAFAGERVTVTSAGKDKVLGTPDDIIITKP